MDQQAQHSLRSLFLLCFVGIFDLQIHTSFPKMFLIFPFVSQLDLRLYSIILFQMGGYSTYLTDYEIFQDLQQKIGLMPFNKHDGALQIMW